MRKKRILSAVAVCALLISLHLPEPANALSSSEIRRQINVLKEEKKAIQEKIKDVQTQYEENENEIANIISRKNVIDQQIQLLYAQISNINDQISAFKVLIADKQDELDSAKSNYENLAAENNARIRTMEEEGAVSYWEVIFRANSFSDLLDRLNMVEEIAEADRRHLQQLSEAADSVALAQEELEAEKAEQEKTKQELDAAEQELEGKRQEADALIMELLEKAEDLEALEAEFEAQEAAFLEDIAAMEIEYSLAKQAEWEAYMATYVPPTTQAAASTTTGNTQPSGNASNSTSTNTSVSSGGTWLVPCSYTSITSPFGYRTSPTTGASTYHQGVDLDTGTGWPVYATRSGIAYTAYGSAAGNYVTIDHQDGFKSIYMHLSGFSVSSGTIVSAGQQIGLTGSTGVSTGDHLHFGISYNGAYVNPCQYVNLS